MTRNELDVSAMCSVLSIILLHFNAHGNCISGNTSKNENIAFIVSIVSNQANDLMSEI